MNGPHQQSNPFEQPHLPVPQQPEIDRVCNAFEAQWRAGTGPKIEDYLDRVDASLRTALLSELIATEIDLRQAVDQDVDIDEYRRRFPSDLAAVEAGWALIASREVKADEVPSTLNVSKDAKMDTGDEARVAEPHADKEANPDQLPSNIGRYEIRKLLGKGGFGRVYLASDPQLQRQVALKVPRRKWLSSEKRIEAMLHEVRSAAQLKHPGLVVVHDVQHDEDDVYIVQEYVDGQDLRHWAKANNPPVDRIVQLMIEIAEAMREAGGQTLLFVDNGGGIG